MRTRRSACVTASRVDHRAHGGGGGGGGAPARIADKRALCRAGALDMSVNSASACMRLQHVNSYAAPAATGGLGGAASAGDARIGATPVRSLPRPFSSARSRYKASMSPVT